MTSKRKFLETNSNLFLKKKKTINAKMIHIIRFLFGSSHNYLIATAVMAKPDLLLT